jgi:[ribosomal protein S5]-alanine N-acetyltransferase
MKTMETERLAIRNFAPDDWQALHEMIVQYESSPYAVYDQKWPVSPDEIRGVAEWFAGGDSFLAVCLRDGGRLIGLVSLNPEEAPDRRQYNLGYIFDSDYHGKGYATEACQAVLGHAFAALQAEAVVSGTAAANGPSCRLLERLGFTKTGEAIGSFWKTPEGQPIEFMGNSFALTRSEWQATRP